MDKELQDILEKEILSLYSDTNKEHGVFIVNRLVQKIRQAGYQKGNIEKLKWKRPKLFNAGGGVLACSCHQILHSQRDLFDH